MSAILKIKKLNEQAGAKTLEARKIIDAAKDGVLTVEDRSKVDAIQNEVASIHEQIALEGRQAALESQKVPALSRQESRDVGKFDYNKVLNAMVRSINGMSGGLDGIENEIVTEGANEARAAGVNARGIVLPRFMVRGEKRDMTATGTTSTSLDQGGMTIATNKGGLLDDFFNASVMRAGGATVIEGLVGNLDIPRIVAGTAGAYKAENAAADEVSPTTAMVSFSPGRLPAYIDVSERLMLQSSSAIERVLRSHLTAQMLATAEAAFFHGGGTNEPGGIAGTSGIGSVAGGTNGAAPTYANIVALETAVDASNALLGNLHYVSNGQVRGKLKTTPVVSSTDSRMILGDSGMLNGYSPLWTNAVSRTLTKGSSGAVASAIFFGNLADYWITFWSGISLELIRDKTNATTGLYTLVAATYYDGNVVRPKSFAAMLDALAA